MKTAGCAYVHHLLHMHGVKAAQGVLHTCSTSFTYIVRIAGGIAYVHHLLHMHGVKAAGGIAYVHHLFRMR